MITKINGQPADWSEEIWRWWYTVADTADPKLTTSEVYDANYFTPRPYVDEYNRGSRECGFVYTVGRSVYQALIP
jgi:hypothetical protein